uniref:E3 ubiquitin-protein ligase TRIM39-like n=1 Tax=Erpetoichthys calabaricus TaxID=27687 RepID=A0A8C4T3G6_ERPCA
MKELRFLFPCLTCPVCLDIFTSPISTPCGHSFCMECITRYWGRSGDCICPFCKKIFRQRPDLNINRTLAEITEEFKQTRVMYSDLCFAAPGDVSCDVCSRRKFKAVKSCLVCLASFLPESYTRNCFKYIKLLSWWGLYSLYFLSIQKEQSVCEPSNSQDLDPVTSSVDSDLLLGVYRKAFGELSDMLRVKLEKTTEAVHLTLDPHTASPSLTLSADGKEVCYGDAEQEIPDNPLRFDIFFSVLSKEGFTSGRHYWEVKVGEKTDWILGVVRESINRKGDIELCPQNGYWTVSLCYGSGYWAFTSPSTFLALNIKPRKVGVFLDYEEGQLSFFNVESQTHLYTFIDIFTEKLYPYFSPCANEDGKNAVPL